MINSSQKLQQTLKSKEFSYHREIPIMLKVGFAKFKNHNQEELVQIFGYTFVHEEVSFLLISPSNLGILYDIGTVLNDSLGSDKVHVYFEGIAFLSLSEFSRLEDYHICWMCKLYQISLNNFGNLKQYAVFYDLDNPHPKEIAMKDKIFNPENIRDNFLILPSSKSYQQIFKTNGGRMSCPIVSSVTEERKFEHWCLDLEIESIIRITCSEESQNWETIPASVKTLGGQNLRHLLKNGVIDLNTYIENRNGFVSQEEYNNLIISAKYLQKTAYSVQKVIRNQCSTSALDFKKILSGMHTLSNESEQMDFDARFGFDDKQLSQMSLKEFLYRKNQNVLVSSSGKNKDDIAVIRLVDEFHDFEFRDEDDILILEPLVRANVFDYVNFSQLACKKAALEREIHTSGNKTSHKYSEAETSRLFSCRVDKTINQKFNKRAIILSSRHLNVEPYDVQTFNKWCKIPSIIGNYQHRSIYIQFLHRFELRIQNPVRPILYQAFLSPDLGEKENYESLETIGDGVLKFITVFVLICASRQEDKEGKLVRIKGGMVSNYRLSKLSFNHRIYVYLQKKALFRDDWWPPLLQGRMIKRSKSENCDGIMLKNAADVYEAILGGLFMDNHDLSQCLSFLLKTRFFEDSDTITVEDFLQQLKIKVQLNHTKIFLDSHFLDQQGAFEAGHKLLNKDSTFLDLWRVKNWQVVDGSLEEFQEKIGYMFNHPHLLRLAFTVKEFPAKGDRQLNSEMEIEDDQGEQFSILGKNLEKLELLGDAVFELLYLAIICRLFWKDGELISPGKITEGKIFILSNLNMAKMAANLNIHRYVQNCTSEIVESLNQTGIYLKNQCKIMKCREFKQPDITITKSLSDMWESLAGALLIDGGWPAINQVLIPILMPYIEFYYQHHSVMDLNLKGQAIEILNSYKDIELKLSSQTKEGFTVELQIPHDLCDNSDDGKTRYSSNSEPDSHLRNTKYFSNPIKEKAIAEAHAYLVSLFRQRTTYARL